MTDLIVVRTRRFAAACALLAAALAFVALASHATAQPLSGTWRDWAMRGMAPLTALALLACSGALLLRLGRKLRLMQAALALVALVVAALLWSHLAHGSDVLNPALIDGLSGAGSGALPSALPGSVSGGQAPEAARTSLLTALCLSIWALALWMGSRDSGHAGTLAVSGTASWTVSWGAGLVLLASGTAWLNNLYGADNAALLPVFDGMSPHAAAALFLLALGLVAVDPLRGAAAIVISPNKAGGATRRQLALLLVVPLIGLLLDRLFDAGLLQEGALLALLVMATVAPFVVLILRDGRLLDRVENAQRDQAQLTRDFANQLQTQLEERTRELEAAHADKLLSQSRQQQSQRMETVGQLTGGIAHDFNNLLQAINGQLELALRHSHEPGKLREDVEHAQASVWRAAKLSTKLLAFSRTQDLAIRPISIGATMQGVRQLIGGSLGPDVDIALRLPDDADALYALADTDQLEHALLNLALNARQAMPGGGTLTVAVALAKRTLHPWSPPSEYVSVKVSDTGVGMSPDVVSRAAEPFFTTREPGTASGLGLAQVYGFVVQCNGSMDIQSTPGQGTTVELLLPRTSAPAAANGPTTRAPAASSLATQASSAAIAARKAIAAASSAAAEASASASAAAAAAAAAGALASASTPSIPSTPPAQPAIPPAPVPQSGRTVLVIDDDDNVRATLVAVLEYEGYRVVAAANGAEGLALLETQRPEVLVVDFIMPGLNGAEVARRARRMHPDLPVVFVSGYSDTVELASIPHAAVVGKPFDVDRLVQAVESVV